jgi:hypothetical protein
MAIFPTEMPPDSDFSLSFLAKGDITVNLFLSLCRDPSRGSRLSRLSNIFTVAVTSVGAKLPEGLV